MTSTQFLDSLPPQIVGARPKSALIRELSRRLPSLGDARGRVTLSELVAAAVSGY